MAPMSPAEDLPSLESEDALTAGSLGFMPRLLVLTTLPHRRPASHRFKRVNGRHSLRLSAPRRVGLPYGSYPRLLLVYLTTEAVRARSPEIRLGPTFNQFMYSLGLTPVTGKRGTVSRMRDQLHRLFSTTIRWTYADESRGHASGRGCIIAGEHELWRSPRASAQQPSWRSRVVLGSEFFDEITRSPVPVDLRALRLLKRSPLALDIYVWLTYRMSYLSRPCLVPWEALQRQFGANYIRHRDFRQRFVRSLARVVHVYSQVRVSQIKRGLWLFPSRSHIARPTQAGRTSPVRRQHPSDSGAAGTCR